MAVFTDKGLIIRILLTIIFMFGFGVFLAPCFTGILNLGNIFGMVFFAMLTFVTVMWKKLIPLYEIKWVKISIIAILIFGGICFIFACIISGIMINAMHSPPADDNTVLVVLGCKVRGEKPSGMLSYRTYTAYNYLKDHPDVKVVVSGGQGSDELISEAECMKRILISKGISEDRIFMEDKSTNTYENILYSSKVIEDNMLDGTITIVTNEFHNYRAKLIAHKQGFDVYSLSAPTMRYLLPTYWIREIFAIVKETLF